MPKPAQKSFYKSQLGEDCVYVHLHPDSSLKSPYMELTRLSSISLTEDKTKGPQTNNN